MYREKGGQKEVIISNPTDFPDVTDSIISRVKSVLEPIVKATIIVPQGALISVSSSESDTKRPCAEYLGDMMDLCFAHRAEGLDHKYLDASGALSSRIILTCTVPLSEIVTDFFDRLKSRSSGFASFE